MCDLSILIPVLRRPDNAARQVDDIVAVTEADYRIVFISTTTDVDEHQAVDALRGRSDVDVRHLTMGPTKVGDYAKKINFAAASFASTWYFLAADDLHFHPDWFDEATLCHLQTDARVIGTQDLGNSRVLRGEHSTHSLVHRSYIDELGTIDEPGKVLHESYPHEFVDDEFVETAKMRGEFAFAEFSVVEHLHPLWGKAPTDRLYDDHRRRMGAGRVVYARRRRLWTSR